jgi:hypothetical protein
MIRTETCFPLGESVAVAGTAWMGSRGAKFWPTSDRSAMMILTTLLLAGGAYLTGKVLATKAKHDFREQSVVPAPTPSAASNAPAEKVRATEAEFAGLPADRYLSAACFTTEMAKIFGRIWLYACHSSELAAPGGLCHPGHRTR